MRAIAIFLSVAALAGCADAPPPGPAVQQAALCIRDVVASNPRAAAATVTDADLVRFDFSEDDGRTYRSRIDLYASGDGVGFTPNVGAPYFGELGRAIEAKCPGTREIILAS
ncbi:MAG TPA: hypothetical protein VGG48_05195 [Rhizomicrobium sp.]|jgi:hypothetical protein